MTHDYPKKRNIKLLNCPKGQLSINITITPPLRREFFSMNYSLFCKVKFSVKYEGRTQEFVQGGDKFVFFFPRRWGGGSLPLGDYYGGLEFLRYNKIKI